MVIEKSRRKTVYVTTIYSNVEICHTPSLTWCPKMHTNFNEKTRWPLECQLKIWIEMAAIITEGLVCQGILLSNQVTSPLQIRMESPEACDADFYTVFFFAQHDTLYFSSQNSSDVLISVRKSNERKRAPHQEGLSMSNSLVCFKTLSSLFYAIRFL